RMHRLALLLRTRLAARPVARLLLLLFGAGAALLARPAFAQVDAAGNAPITWYVDDSVADGLVAHWRFDRNSSTPLVLETVNAAHGTLLNGAAIVDAPVFPDPRPGLISENFGMLRLDGVNDFVEVTSPSPLNVGSSFTFMAWVRRESTALAQIIFDSGEQTDAWVIYFDNPNGELAFGTPSSTYTSTVPTPEDGSYVHVAVVKNGDTGNNLAFYVNGGAVGTAAVGALQPMSGKILIGGSDALGPVFVGDIDDVRLFNRALSADEVVRLANGSGCATDGFSWATAFRDLSCALDRDINNDQIWVGEGLYRPGTSDEGYYEIDSSISLYGGFLGLSPGGSETAIDQRPAFDPAAPLTILSGDLRGDDQPGNLPLREDNAGPVVYAVGDIGFTLDGFAVQDGDGINDGAGLRLLHTGAATLRNLALTNHSTINWGGALYT
ncbi:MAG: LamG domain-containing protein, partial [Caldilineaceae bacterium]